MFAKDKACHGKNECEELAHKAGHKLREVVDMAGNEARDVKATVVNEFRQHPVKSSAIAAGIGFVLGFLLRRR